MRKLVLLLSMMTCLAFAAESNVWQPVAAGVCDEVKQATSLYQKGDLKNAHLTAIMSYFKGYDTELEPAVRVTVGGQHVFEMERKFRDFAASMTPNPDKKKQKEVETLATELCQAIDSDAKVLNDAKIERQVFKVQS